MTSKLISYDTRVEINYYITIPEYLNLKIENKYGDVYMEDNTGYTDVTLAFEAGSSYNIDIRHLNAFLVISDKNARIEKKVLNEDNKEFITTGIVGKNPGGSKVSIAATHGDIYLK